MVLSSNLQVCVPGLKGARCQHTERDTGLSNRSKALTKDPALSAVSPFMRKIPTPTQPSPQERGALWSVLAQTKPWVMGERGEGQGSSTTLTSSPGAHLTPSRSIFNSAWRNHGSAEGSGSVPVSLQSLVRPPLPEFNFWLCLVVKLPFTSSQRLYSAWATLVRCPPRTL